MVRPKKIYKGKLRHWRQKHTTGLRLRKAQGKTLAGTSKNLSEKLERMERDYGKAKIMDESKREEITDGSHELAWKHLRRINREEYQRFISTVDPDKLEEVFANIEIALRKRGVPPKEAFDLPSKVQTRMLKKLLWRMMHVHEPINKGEIKKLESYRDGFRNFFPSIKDEDARKTYRAALERVRKAVSTERPADVKDIEMLASLNETRLNNILKKARYPTNIFKDDFSRLRVLADGILKEVRKAQEKPQSGGLVP